MEKKPKKNNIIYRNVFNNINFLKGNKINYHYLDAMNKLEKFSTKVNNFIDYVEKSIENDMASTGRFSKKIFRSLMNQKSSKIIMNISQKYNSNRFLRLNSKFKTNTNTINYSLEIPKKKQNIKNIHYFKSNKSIKFEKKNKNGINNYHQKSYFLLRKGPNHLSNSLILNNSKKITNFFKTRNISVSNSKINEGSNTSKKRIDNYNYIYNKNLKNERNVRPQSATMINTVNEYNYKSIKPKNKSSNKSKNLSASLYRTNKNYFSHYKSVLKPELLMKFVKRAKKMQKSYKNDLEVNMNKKTKKLLKIAEDEINMKDPEYHHREIFKNVLHVKKTLKEVQRMRGEHKIKVKYFGPGNVNNEILMRMKNANLVNFCDSVSNMKDEKFYEYRKILNDVYPNFAKNVFKQKYQASEKDEYNDNKFNDNIIKIDRLIAQLQNN